MEDSKTKKLYRNVLDSDWNALKKEALSFENDIAELLRPISVHGDSIVHLVVHSGTEEPLKQILNLLHGYSMSVNNYGNTVLHEAAISGNLEAVRLLVENDEELLVMENDSNETPLFKAAAFGKTKIVKFLASREGQTVDSSDGTKQLKDIHRKNKNGETVLFAAVQGQHFDTALELLKIDEKLTELEDGNQTSLNMLAQIPSAFKAQYKMSIWKKLLFSWFLLPKKIWKEKRDHVFARELARKLRKKDKYVSEQNLMQSVFNPEPTENLLLAAIRSRNVEAVTWALDKYPQQLEQLNRKILNLATKEEEREQGNTLFAALRTGNVEFAKLTLEKYPQQLDILNLRIQKISDEDANSLFAAIRAGNVEVVKLILEEYPQALEQINIKNQNMLHVAVMYRQKEIYDLVKTNVIPMIRLARQIDIDGYTILHSVADTQHYKGGTRLGPAYRLQEELKWFYVRFLFLFLNLS
ncbi:hypothetical protein LWI29_025965 [Acer saccharum]|uniref:Uncharacterized protein n=1 Tax=Acer saccharum TaxID=4024 RepID=A0AA39RR54_ACESA|nr:hypothetical protein LWI29_025965 [Acer saccharum]